MVNFDECTIRNYMIDFSTNILTKNYMYIPTLYYLMSNIFSKTSIDAVNFKNINVYDFIRVGRRLLYKNMNSIL